MTQSVVLICPKDIAIADLSSLLEARWRSQFVKTSEPAREFQLQSDDASWYINFFEMTNREEIAKDYQTNEFLNDNFRVAALHKRFYLVSFSDFSTTRKVLVNILEGLEARIENVWVDTDYGKVILGKEFLTNLKKDKEWDWRAV